MCFVFLTCGARNHWSNYLKLKWRCVTGASSQMHEQTSYQISTPDRVDVLAGYGVFVYTRDGVVRSVRIGGGNQFNPTTGGVTPIAPEVINDVSVKIAALPEGAVTPPTQTFTRPFNFFISPTKQK